MNRRWLIGVILIKSLYLAFIFLSTRLSGRMITTKSNGDKESPWKIPLLMLIVFIIIVIIIIKQTKISTQSKSRTDHLNYSKQRTGFHTNKNLLICSLLILNCPSSIPPDVSTVPQLAVL